MSGTVRLAEVLAEKDARIAELEAADAEDNLCLRTAIERNAELEAEVARIKELVSAQAEDGGLWFAAETAPEAYLQQELRKLHAAIEGEQRNCIAELEAEVARLLKAINDFREGNYPNPRYYRYMGGKCPHDFRYWQECPDCDEKYWQSVLPQENKQV